MLAALKQQVDLLVLVLLLAPVTLATLRAVEGRQTMLGRGQGAPFCQTDESPAFTFGFAALSDLLDSRMGRPLECEHPDIATGDTLQLTTTGLAVYRRCTNTPTFAIAQDHWALTPEGPLHWTGPSVDPPVLLPLVQASSLRRPCPSPR